MPSLYSFGTGNVGGDPEIRRTNSGGEMITFSVAFNTGRGDDQKTTWLRCVSFNENRVDFIDKNVRKGARVTVRGQINLNEWEGSDGATHSTLEMWVDDITLHDWPDDGRGRGRPDERGRGDRGDDRGGRAAAGRDDRGGDRGGRDTRDRDDRGGDRGGYQDRRGETRGADRSRGDDRGRDTRGADRGRGDDRRGDDRGRGGYDRGTRGGDDRRGPSGADDPLIDDAIPF